MDGGESHSICFFRILWQNMVHQQVKKFQADGSCFRCFIFFFTPPGESSRLKIIAGVLYMGE
jgi:hypothetical protein